MPIMWLWRLRELVELSALPAKQLESTFPKSSMGIVCFADQKENRIARKAKRQSN
jgi:hypothetical protein